MGSYNERETRFQHGAFFSQLLDTRFFLFHNTSAVQRASPTCNLASLLRYLNFFKGKRSFILANNSRRAYSTMADQKDSVVDTVYLEDIEEKKIVKKQEDGDKGITTVLEKEERQSTTTITGVKRQRTLMEMAALTPKSNSLDKNGKDLEPSLKKQKVIAVSKGASKAATGLQPLNSIPFSMQAFKDSLNEKEKELLALECETMGKSW